MTATRARFGMRVGTAGCAVLVIATFVVVVGQARPARACSCLVSTEGERFARADVVFRGEVVGYQPPPPAQIMSSADPATWTFAVSETYKGEVAPVQEVVSAVSGASCGLEIPHEGEFFVFANHPAPGGAVRPNQYHADLCGGTRSVREGPLDVAPAATTPVTAPPPAEVTTVPVTPPASVVPETTVAEPAPTTTAPPVTPPASTEVVADPIRDSGGLPGGSVAVGVAAALLLAVGVAVRWFVRS